MPLTFEGQNEKLLSDTWAGHQVGDWPKETKILECHEGTDFCINFKLWHKGIMLVKQIKLVFCKPPNITYTDSFQIMF
jgi:hypothetical protein